MSLHLPPFDSNNEFKALTSFRGDGSIWLKNARIDKARFTERTLQMMYETHKIAPATDEEFATLALADQETADKAKLAADLADQALADQKDRDDQAAIVAEQARLAVLEDQGVLSAPSQSDLDQPHPPVIEPLAALVPVISRDDQISQLVANHTRDELFGLAINIPIADKATKTKIATLIVGSAEAE